MLKQRIVTALVLLAICLLALLAPSPRPFMALAAVLLGAAAWEWARLAQIRGIGAWATGVLCVAVCFLLDSQGLVGRSLAPFWGGVALVWVAAGGGLLARGVPAWARVARALRWLIGVAVLCVAWLAVARARTIGINFLLSVLFLVWSADVCAYFAGRALGGRFTRGRKLAPTISPGKTWEGVAGGVLGAAVMAVLWIGADRLDAVAVPSVYSRLLERGWVFLLLGVVLMVAVSVIGDLFESLVKRAAGVKDSSALLPGHGGVLDRVDALLPTLPVALALISVGGGA